MVRVWVRSCHKALSSLLCRLCKDWFISYCVPTIVVCRICGSRSSPASHGRHPRHLMLTGAHQDMVQSPDGPVRQWAKSHGHTGNIILSSRRGTLCCLLHRGQAKSEDWLLASSNLFSCLLFSIKSLSLISRLNLLTIRFKLLLLVPFCVRMRSLFTREYFLPVKVFAPPNLLPLPPPFWKALAYDFWALPLMHFPPSPLYCFDTSFPLRLWIFSASLNSRCQKAA